MPRLSFHRFALASLILIAGAIPAAAENTITAGKAWSRATPQGAQVAAGYLTIVNHGDKADRLVSVSTSIAGTTEIHQMKMADGKMEMRPVPEGIEIPAKGTVVLEPMGYHLMLMDLKHPLQKGETFAGSLTFEHAGEVAVTFDVESMGAMGPSAE
jgi:periplasmic copper chaperone A